ncbi:MAG TPA: hypothetical protein VI603_10050 [Saprospiraceae bacterium]|nr:hypothetical protein [Saprospiraceae bacterium]
MLTQIFKSILVLLVISSAFVACKKDDVTINQGPTTIVGKWVGEYGYDTESPSHYYCFNIKTNGTVQELKKSGEVLGSGTWQLVGDVFTATVTWDPPYSSTFDVTATFDQDAGTLTGVWGYAPSDSDGGEWYMNKQN